MIIVSKKPMGGIIDNSVSYTYKTLDEAVEKFKEICSSLHYDYKIEIVDSHPHYVAGGVGLNYRVELNVISSLSDKSY